MSQHTPGPWKSKRTHGNSSDTWYVITDAQGYGPILEVGGKDCNGQIAEAKYLITDPAVIKANVDLITAAPEMLVALESGINMLKCFIGPCDELGMSVINLMRASVRSAKGLSS